MKLSLWTFLMHADASELFLAFLYLENNVLAPKIMIVISLGNICVLYNTSIHFNLRPR